MRLNPGSGLKEDQEMTYRYIEFTDRTAVNSRNRKNGSICYVGKPSEELIKELGLDKVDLSGGSTLFTTTLQVTITMMI